MNKKKIALLLGLITIFLAFVIIIQRTNEADKPLAPSENPKKQTQVTEKDQIDSRTEGVKPSQNIREKYQSQYQKALEERHQWEMQQDFSISFIGQVIDQNGNPIQGVEIVYVVTKYNEDFVSEVLAKDKKTNKTIKTKLKMFSDSNGRFKIESYGRRILLESFKKEGYEKSYEDKRQFDFWNANTSIGSDKPKQYVMWKKENEQIVNSHELIVSEMRSKLSVDGKAHSYDFLIRKKNENIIDGDIVISFFRDKDADRHSKYDWSFKIEAVNGGIQETEDTFLYLAPRDGYSDSYAFEMKKDASEWSNRIKRKKFYVKSRDGRVYTALEIEVRSYYQDGAWMSLEWVTNDQSSTNLEVTNAP